VIGLEELRAELAAAGDPERAVDQQRYLKSVMPFHGLTSPELRALLRPYLRAFAPSDRAEWERVVRTWWDAAAYREERYAALALARHPSARGWQDADTLDLHAHLVVTGAWWDLVDEIAQHLVGACLVADRERATPVLRGWAVADDVWLRRSAVICQNALGAEVDRDLLTHAVEHNLEDRTFWIRKAIGWALRQQARTDPAWVRSYVDALDGRLSGLSRREATKHL
jgi:3-methyladenine DNA glycosylase AlkD